MTCLNASSSTTAEKKNQSQNSEDSSSSTEDDTRAVILTNDRGTSSLQLSDSEEEKLPTRQPSLSINFNRRKVEMQTNSATENLSKKLMNVADTDSVNENFSPVRPSTKRKRKFKRMALDPENNSVAMETGTGKKTGTIKRKKVRSKSACDSGTGSGKRGNLKSPSSGGQTVTRQRQVSTANVIPGKRKRSSREKSVEPDLIVHNSQSSVPSHSMITEEVFFRFSIEE